MSPLPTFVRNHGLFQDYYLEQRLARTLSMAPPRSGCLRSRCCTNTTTISRGAFIAGSRITNTPTSYTWRLEMPGANWRTRWLWPSTIEIL